jgi:AcrR family transcriptional regulator
MTEPSVSTRDRILNAAERLFADHGFESTSIRAIIGEAGVNLAAIHYHFRSKEALLEAVLQRRISDINAERLRRLDAAEAAAAPRPAVVEEVLAALVIPTVEFALRDESGSTFVRLMGRILGEPKFSLSDFFRKYFGSVIARFSEALVRALPHLPREIVLCRVFFVAGALIHLLRAGHTIDVFSPGLRGGDYASISQDFIEFAAAGLRAPHPAAGEAADAF